MNFKLIAVFFLTIGIIACGQETKTPSRFERGKALAELQNERLKEISGLASSVRNKGMLWTHNDRGNDPEIYLLNEQLDVVATCYFNGIDNRDWEDIAVGPGPDPAKSYIYIGDIGDNKAAFPYKYIYRFEEPVVSPGQADIHVTAVDKIVFQLPHEIKDTESLMIDHRTKNLYVVSKRESPVYLYEIKQPYSSGDTVTAAKVMSLPFPEIVGADYCSKQGDVLMKNYESVYYWENAANEDLVTLLKRQPVEVEYAEEPQGEAIAWAVDGSGFYTLSEKKKKLQSFLYFYEKRFPKNLK